MNKTDEQIGFEQAAEGLRTSAANLIYAASQHTPDEAKDIHDAMIPTLVKIKAMADGIRAAKRNGRLEEIAKLMPKVGEQVVIDICNDWGCETWIEVGKVIVAWLDDEHDDPAEWHLWAVIDVTRELTPEENQRLSGDEDGYQSDRSWNGCQFVCRFGFDDWRAKFPVNDLAKKAWAAWGDDAN
jgi:hypothetical protein